MAPYEPGDAAKWGDAQLRMRVAQGVAVPRVVADNPLEFGEVHAELEKRRLKAELRIALLAASIGVVGAILGGVCGAALTIWLSK